MELKETIMMARNGDNTAITSLYEAYKKPVYFLCLKFMGNPKDAANVLQYTYFQAFHKLGALKNPDNFETWLYIIATNRCKMLLREKYPLRFASDNEKSRLGHVKFDISNARMESQTVAQDYDGRTAVAQIIDKMTDMVRLSTVMYFYCGITVVQISKVLNVDEQQVKQYILNGQSQIDAEMETMSAKVQSLKGYTGIGELSDILHACAEDCIIADELDEAITATSVTLVMSSVNATPGIDNGGQQSGGAHSEYEQHGGSSSLYNAKKRTAIFNIIMIVVILVLAAAIIITSVTMIRNAAGNGVPDDSGTSQESATDPVQQTTDSESVTEAPENTTAPEEATTAPEVTTEPEATEPDETQAIPVPENQGSAMTKDEADKLFVCKAAGENIIIEKYVGSAKEVDIPGSIGGKPVVTIGDNAFKGNTSIVSVSIPNSIKTIGTYTFMNCTNLLTIKIPSSVTSVGLTAFGGTAWMNAQKDDFVIVGDGVLIRYIGTAADVTLPSTVKHLTNAFYYNNYVKSVTLSSSVTTIGKYAFCASAKLTTITLTSSVTTIDADAIYDCGSLTKIVAPTGSAAEAWLKDKGYSAVTANS